MAPIEQQTSPLLLESIENEVLRLTLNRPEKRNTLSLKMIAALKTAIHKAEQSNDVSVIVIDAKGPVFSAGHDLNEMSAQRGADQDAQREILSSCTEMMLAIQGSTLPFIASVAGIATAAGCQLVATCDLAVASEDARFCLPGVNIGGFCTTPLVGVSRKVSRKHAMELALTGDMFSAEDAMRFGLINRVVPSSRLHDETRELAEKIAAKSSKGIGLGKKAFYQQADMPVAEAYAFAIERMIEVNSTDHAVEGTRAFFEKRDPKWDDE